MVRNFTKYSYPSVPRNETTGIRLYKTPEGDLVPSVTTILGKTKDMTGLDAGDLYYLSPTTAGAMTTTAPTTGGQAVVRLGESSTATKFAIQIEPPILLS